MKCAHCGADIPEGDLYCGKCGLEVQMVPDYSPLEDVLTKEVKGSINRYTDPQRTPLQKPKHPGSSASKHAPGRSKGRRKDRKRWMLLTCGAILLVLLFLGAVLYVNSYMGIVRSGRSDLRNGEYAKAQTQFQRAIGKDETRPEAYQGMAQVYERQDDLQAAEQVFLTALEGQPENRALYEACIAFYQDTDQLRKIPILLADAPDAVTRELAAYIVAEPTFSLEEGTYEEVQQVTLEGEGEIYYTLNGTDPTDADTRYTEPVLLNEGKNELRAVCYNREGIPSLVASRTYQIDIPVAAAPAVTPSTGQYFEPTKISIQVPEGYTAYYTLDNTTPGPQSHRYTEPVDMPEGQTIFTAVLIDGQGRTTQVTKRNYMLDLQG